MNIDKILTWMEGNQDKLFFGLGGRGEDQIVAKNNDVQFRIEISPFFRIARLKYAGFSERLNKEQVKRTKQLKKELQAYDKIRNFSKLENFLS